MVQAYGKSRPPLANPLAAGRRGAHAGDRVGGRGAGRVGANSGDAGTSRAASDRAAGNDPGCPKTKRDGGEPQHREARSTCWPGRPWRSKTVDHGGPLGGASKG